jgi:hypothetical protein
MAVLNSCRGPPLPLARWSSMENANDERKDSSADQSNLKPQVPPPIASREVMQRCSGPRLIDVFH